MAHPLAFLSPHFHRIARLFLVSILLLGMLAVAPSQAARLAPHGRYAPPAAITPPSRLRRQLYEWRYYPA